MPQACLEWWGIVLADSEGGSRGVVDHRRGRAGALRWLQTHKAVEIIATMASEV